MTLKSKKLRLLFLFLWIVKAGICQNSVSGLPFTRNFNTVDYNAGIQNWHIAEDKRGLLYIANNFGLLEYDGSKWKIYGVRNGTKLRSVAIDSRGKIYVGCQGDFGFFFPDKAGTLQYTSLADSLEARYRDFDEAWSIYIDGNKVYFCTFSRIYTYDQSGFTVTETTAGIDQSYLVNKQLYINERSAGLGILEGKMIHKIKGGEFFTKLSISSILPLHSNHLLISTFRDGVFEMIDEEVRPWNNLQQNYFKDAIVNCMIRLRNGNFAAGTQNNGLLILDPEGNILLQLTRGKGIANRTILSLHEDDLNNLWVGQNNGIAYVELGSPFTFINEQIGLPGSGYAAYLEDDKLFLGTNTGVYLHERGKDDYKLIDNTRGQVYSIGKYNNDLLVGHHNGALRIEGLTATRISTEPGSWIFLNGKQNQQKLIGGVYSGLQLYTMHNGHWKYQQKIKGFGESSRVMAQDPSGDIWVTHGYKGAYKIKLNTSFDSIEKVSFYGADKAFPTNLLINVFKMGNDLLFSSERGVYKYNSETDTFIPDPFFSSMLGKNAQVWFMQDDALGNIYFISREHIGMFRKNSIGEYTLEANAFNKIRRYMNDDLMSIAVLKNNEVLFGAKDGFIHFSPIRNTNHKPSFKTLIRRVNTTADSVLFSGNYIRNDSVISSQPENFKPQLPYKNNSMNFVFAATSFEGNADLSYQYLLENYEKNWSEWSNQTNKEYTNLKEGKYIFHVRAKNVNGEVSDESSFEFQVSPPWYRSVLAYAFYSVSILAILFTGFNVIDRKYQREQKVMEQNQKDALDKKENELEKLSQQSQEEINRLQNEKLESELRHMNNELATSTMHLLNKNEFITGIKTNLDHILKKNPNEDLKKELSHITKEIEHNISADADWEHFQFHFDRVHGDFSNRFKAAFPALSPQDIKLSAYLRMNLSSKEIAQLLNISLRGVEISRYRLRKKLSLDRNRNLQEFILNF
jgi:DNA-binding CsgD family transcriptional regulator